MVLYNLQTIRCCFLHKIFCRRTGIHLDSLDVLAKAATDDSPAKRSDGVRRWTSARLLQISMLNRLESFNLFGILLKNSLAGRKFKTGSFTES